MRGSNRFGGWPLLALLQAAVSLVLFHDYIFGPKYFAFVDIGSDTYAQFVPMLMQLANPANWTSAWSFNVGLGAVFLPISLTPFTLLGIAGGAEHVLDMRIWVYLAKLGAGGAAFYGFVLTTGARREIALMVALAYTFCGYVVTDGQWDPSSTEFVAYALLLWAIASRSSQGSVWFIPAAVAFAAYSGAFIFSVGVFVVFVFAAAITSSERPVATLSIWLRSIFPRCALGLILAAPVVVPLVFILLDSPRVTGVQASFGVRAQEMLSFNNPITVLIQLATLFHKNILGVGDQHAGWMNYLESPVFYVGVLPLLLIPQLWRGSATDRRILVAGSLAIALFIALPAIRYLAYGFGLDYFRVNNLWISILLLAMFARALSCIAEHGVHRWLLGGTAAVLTAGLVLIESELRPHVSVPHALKILAFLLFGLALTSALGRAIRWRQFSLLALIFVALDAVVINYPSFHAGRVAVTRQTPSYRDSSLAAVEYLKKHDTGIYRIEKTFNSVSFCDAMAQDYMGVKSYWFQGRSMVDLYSGLGLIPPSSPLKNYTNWLPNFGPRFVLNSLFGVKYVIANSAPDWAGFRKIHEIDGVSIFQNDLVAPLGVVYERQFPRERFAALSLEAKDIVMTNAVIVDEVRGASPKLFDIAQLGRQSADWMGENYVAPARQLQRRGLRVEEFSHGRVSGQIVSEVPGVLVFSIPYSKGWTITINSVEQPVFRANLGMLASDIFSGKHHIELRYSLPGFKIGLLAGAFGLLGLWTLGVLERRYPRSLIPGAKS